MSNTKLVYRLIIAVSLLIPLAVALLFYMPGTLLSPEYDVSYLPAFHATLNSITTVLLLLGFWFIKQGRVLAHRYCMTSAVLLSAIFLVSYVLYHASTEPTTYGGTGWLRTVYYVVLISHIVLAIAIVPLVLLTLYRALSNQLSRHRRIARWTLPLWLYVTITGVVVYLMIAPYY